MSKLATRLVTTGITEVEVPTLDSIVVGSGGEELATGVEAERAHQTGVAVKYEWADGGERLQVARFGQLRHQILGLDRQAHLLGARAQVQVEAPHETLTCETPVGWYRQKRAELLRHERVLALVRVISLERPSFDKIISYQDILFHSVPTRAGPVYRLVVAFKQKMVQVEKRKNLSKVSRFWLDTISFVQFPLNNPHGKN